MLIKLELFKSKVLIFFSYRTPEHTCQAQRDVDYAQCLQQMTSPDIHQECVARNFHGISQPNFVPAPQANSNLLISYNQLQQESSAFAQHGNILGPPLPIHPQILRHTPVP
jgi:hypothetical protein